METNKLTKKQAAKKAELLATELIETLISLGLKLPPKSSCGYIAIWIHSDSRKIEFANQEIHFK